MKSNSRRAAAAVLISLVALPGTAFAAGPEGHASTASTASLERQLTKLKRQVKKLKLVVASIPPAQAGPQGVPGPQGPAGAAGPAGPAGLTDVAAGGDLTGAYPNPQIVDSAIGSLQLADNAITHDTSAISSALGHYTTKIGSGAIGRSEIADGQVQASELGTITKRGGSKDFTGVAGVAAECEPGEVRLSGGGSWGGIGNLSLISSAPFFENGWNVVGRNEGSDPKKLTAYVLCLS